MMFALTYLALLIIQCGSGGTYWVKDEERLHSVYQTMDGIAIEGYDPVAYFTMGEPIQGTSEYTYIYQDAIWYFANEEHRAMFKDNPEAYLPQYGGFCAWSVAENNYIPPAPSDPTAWYIHDGKLYLNYNDTINKKWIESFQEKKPKADRQWEMKKEQIRTELNKKANKPTVSG